MAETARGVLCPTCQTLTACAGAYADAELVGKCACCGRTVTIANQAHYGDQSLAVKYDALKMAHEILQIQYDELLKAHAAEAVIPEVSDDEASGEAPHEA